MKPDHYLPNADEIIWCHLGPPAVIKFHKVKQRMLPHSLGLDHTPCWAEFYDCVMFVISYNPVWKEYIMLSCACIPHRSLCWQNVELWCNLDDTIYHILPNSLPLPHQKWACVHYTTQFIDWICEFDIYITLTFKNVWPIWYMYAQEQMFYYITIQLLRNIISIGFCGKYNFERVSL